jgi:glycosyltransferase involved in cell wall biosynthesis
MRLLFLTETIPFPLDSGGRIKTYHTLRILSSEYEVHCHALVRDERHLRFERDLAGYCASLTLHPVPRSRMREVGCFAWSQATRVPFVIRRHFHRGVLEHIRSACRRYDFDAVYCDHLSMLEYGRRLALPIIVDAHNVEFQIVRRHAATLGWSLTRAFAELEWRRLKKYERQWYPSCRLVFSVSEIDARVIRTVAGNRVPVVVVPIAVDAYAAPQAKTLAADPEILFVGGLHWPPNADAVTYFVQQILPTVRKAIPDARLTVVGRADEPVRRRLGMVPGVRCIGHVDDVEPHFQGSRIMVVPIRSGSGMRVKVLDALARGLPTVSTTVGCEGIDVDAGVHLLVADEPADFAAQVIRLLTDAALARSLADAGRLLVLRAYDTSVVAARILDALRTIQAGALRQSV